MLMNNEFEYNVPYVNYQMLKVGNDFWEVSTPALLTINQIEIHHWKVLDEIRFGWHNYIEVKVHEIDKGYDSWKRAELITMGHLLKSHYFETKEEAEEYRSWYLNQRKIEGR